MLEQDPLIDALARRAQQDPQFNDPEALGKNLPRGKIAITIAADGQWYYRGSVFHRLEMVSLLAKSLLLIDSRHYLLAPEQLLEITVEDCPFVITAVERSAAGDDILLTTHLGDSLTLGEAHPFHLSAPPNSSLEVPAVDICYGLQARLSRPCFYQLADWAEPRRHAGREALQIHSAGCWHLLGYL